MNAMRLSPNKDVRAELRILVDLKFEYQGTNSAGHHVLEHAEHGQITVVNTPGSRGWRYTHRRLLARMVGLTLWELQRLIAGQPIELTARTTRRRSPSSANGGRKALRAVPVVELEPDPEPVVVVPVSADPITPERRREWEHRRAELERANARERMSLGRVA